MTMQAPPSPPLPIADALRLGSLFLQGPHGLELRGSFPSYMAGSQHDAKEAPDKFSGLRVSRLQHVLHDLWNLTAILRHVAWTKGLHDAKTLPTQDWTAYAALDIENFYVQARSLMDHVAEWLEVSVRKRCATPTSFTALLPAARDAVATQKALGQEVASLIAGCTWFETHCTVRDRTVHNGAWTLVAPGPDKSIRFQVYASHAFQGPLVPFKEPYELLDFRSVAASTVGQIVLLLNDLSAAVQKVRAVSPSGGAAVRAPGFRDLLEWCGAEPTLDPRSLSLSVFIGEGESRRCVGEIDGSQMTYARSRINLPEQVARRLIGILGSGAMQRTFDLVRGAETFQNCQMIEMGTSIKMVAPGEGLVSGGCVLAYDGDA